MAGVMAGWGLVLCLLALQGVGAQFQFSPQTRQQGGQAANVGLGQASLQQNAVPRLPDLQALGSQGVAGGNQAVAGGNQGMPVDNQAVPAGNQALPVGNQGVPVGNQGVAGSNQGAQNVPQAMGGGGAVGDNIAVAHLPNVAADANGDNRAGVLRVVNEPPSDSGKVNTSNTNNFNSNSNGVVNNNNGNGNNGAGIIINNNNAVPAQPMVFNNNNQPPLGVRQGQGDFGNVANNMPQQQPQQQPQPQQPVREIGGIKLNWDWSDFAISFEDYGQAEMKVRRAPHPTTGEPWPLPQYYFKKDKRVYRISPDFQFRVVARTCDVLEQGLKRYRRRILLESMEDMYDNLQNAEGTNLQAPRDRYNSDVFRRAPEVALINVKVRKACSFLPTIHSDESYDLVVKKTRAFIWANEVWGALRALETLSQLIWRGHDNKLYVKETVISDYPRFPHRGILIDTSRHYLFKEVIFDILDAMEMNKINVFHWHIVDDQSFPYQSKVYPDLSQKGAFHPEYVYSLEDIAEIIEYGRYRGIRILPEFDTPGHTYSWGLSRPDLLTQCYQGSSPVKGYLGPIDPSKNDTYRFLKGLFTEILDVFKDTYIHLGGDEVPLGCWQSNPKIIQFGSDLQKQMGNRPESASNMNNFNYNNNPYAFGVNSFDVRRVYEYYENRLMSDLRDIGKRRKNGVKFIMWQEVMNNDLQLPNDTIIQVWMGDMGDVNRAISLGYNVLYSTCWYLDHIEYGTKWPKYYQCDPADTSFGYMVDEKKVLGGEACMWAEYVDNENLMTTLWPRASATAERLWSSKEVRDLDSAGERLQEHRCRMLKRGLSVAQVSGPDYCYRRGVVRGRGRTSVNSSMPCSGENCDGPPQPPPVFEVEDIEVHVKRKGGSFSECNNALSQGSSVVLLLSVLVILLAVGVSYTRSSGRIAASRFCKNRTILFLFLTVLFVYFMCYTTIWMQVFEFSGSFHKSVQGRDGQKHT